MWIIENNLCLWPTQRDPLKSDHMNWKSLLWKSICNIFNLVLKNICYVIVVWSLPLCFDGRTSFLAAGCLFAFLTGLSSLSELLRHDSFSMMIRLLLSASGGNCMMSRRKIVNCSFQFEEHMTSETGVNISKTSLRRITLCREAAWLSLFSLLHWNQPPGWHFYWNWVTFTI